MIFNWYNVFNKTDFLSLGLVSKEYTAVLEDVGEKTFLVTLANEICVSFEDVMIPIKFNENNPTVREGDDAHYGVFIDDSNDVWIGIEDPA